MIGDGLKTIVMGGAGLEVIFLFTHLPLDPMADVTRWILILVAGGIVHLALYSRLKKVIAGDDRRAMIVIGLFGLLFRLTLASTGPSLSDDAWRNIWDGRVAHAGFDVYKFAPEAAELFALRDQDVYPKINHKEYPTIYPPVAQIASRSASRVENALRIHPMLAWKLTIAAVEIAGAALLACGLLRAGMASGFLIYAWSPLLVTEFYSSAHVDAVGVGLLAASVGLFLMRRDFLAGFCFVASVLTKFISLPLVAAALSRRTSGRLLLGALVAAVIVIAPFADSTRDIARAVARYEGNWEFNGVAHRFIGVDYWISSARQVGRFCVIHGTRGASTPALRGSIRSVATGGIDRFEWSKGSAAEKAIGRMIAALLFLSIGFAAGAGEASVRSAAVWGLGLFLIVQPTLHPWYVTWMLPLLALKPLAGFLAWPIAAGASYQILFSHRGDGWCENSWMQAFIMFPVLILVARDFRNAWRGREVAIAAVL